MSLCTPRFMQAHSEYTDTLHDCKTLILHTELTQGLSAASSLEKIVRDCKDCSDGAKLHTTVSYQKLQLQLLKGTVCESQRVFLGNNLLLACTPALCTSTIPLVEIKIYRLFPSCQSAKRKTRE